MNGTEVDKLEDVVSEQNLIKISSDIVNVLFGYKSGAFMPIITMQSLYNTMFGVYRKGPVISQLCYKIRYNFTKKL